MKKNKLVNIISIIKTSLLYLSIAFLCTLGIGYLVGYTAIIVNGHSSEPDIPYLSLIIDDKKVSFNELEVGDYITFKMSTGAYVTHQIIAKTNDENSFFDFASNETYEFVKRDKRQTLKFSELKGTPYCSVNKCNIITMQKLVGEDTIKEKNADFINYQANFVGKVKVILPKLGEIISYIRVNYISMIVSISMVVCMFIIFEKEQEYVRLF